MDVVVNVLVTMMMKVKADPSFFSGTLQNLSSPRRPSHPLAPEAVPPAGFPGAPGMPGPHLHYPGVWPAAQGSQWEGNIPGALTSPRINSRLGYQEAAESGYNLCPREFTVSGKPDKHVQNWDVMVLEFYQGQVLQEVGKAQRQYTTSDNKEDFLEGIEFLRIEN